MTKANFGGIEYDTEKDITAYCLKCRQTVVIPKGCVHIHRVGANE